MVTASSFAAAAVGVAVFFATRRDFAFCAVFLVGATFALAAEILFCTVFFIDADLATDSDFVTDIEAAPAAIFLAINADFMLGTDFLASGDFIAGALFVAVFFLAEALLESEASFLTFVLETLAARFLRDAAFVLELSPFALARFFVCSSASLSVRENERTTARAPSFAHFKAADFDSSEMPNVKILRAANFKATPAPSFSAKGVAHTSPPAPIFAAREELRQSFKILSEAALFCAQSPAAPQIASFEALRARAFIANLRSRRFLRAREC